MSQYALRLCLLILVGLTTPVTMAQDASPAELRREIEQLRTQNEQQRTQNEQITIERDQQTTLITAMRDEMIGLANRLDEAMAQIKKLTSQLAALPTTSTEPDQPLPDIQPTTIQQALIPEHHLASPASLFYALKHAYETRFPNPVISTEKDRTDFEQRAQKWALEMNRTMRGRTKWRIRLTDITPRTRGRGTGAHMTVIDPVSGLAIGASFVVEVPSRMAMKLGNEDLQVYELTLMLLPTPIVNPDRLTQSVFDWPPFVGPMVDFAFDFEWIGLRRYRPEVATEPSEAEQMQAVPSDKP